MGWASAGGIFDPIAQVLIDLKADAATKRKVLVTLIGTLRDGDWDTEDESLEQFRHDPATVSAFYSALDGISLDQYGWITYDDGRWSIGCEKCAIDLGSAEAFLGDVEFSAAEHNRLLQVWAEHERAEHDGDGEVPSWQRIRDEAGDLL